MFVDLSLWLANSKIRRIAEVDANTIVVLEGDETGQELLEEALRVLQPAVVGIDVALKRFDLSLESRRKTKNGIVFDAAAAVVAHGLGLKAATITPEQAGDVGSPNRILREEIGGKVIVRTGRRIPGITPIAGVHAPISVVRMAVGDAYGAKEWREGEGEREAAFRTERIERRICHAVAEFSFRLAEQTGAKVFGGPKYTVSPVYEAMLKEEMDAAAERHPAVLYQPLLIDATFALLLSSSGDPLVIPALNRDGDMLSDLVLPLFGSIAGSESLIVAFDDDYVPTAVLAEAAHGTAPSLRGKNVANPMAMILAVGALLSFGNEAAVRASVAIRESCSRSGRSRHADGGSRRSRKLERVRGRGDPPGDREAVGRALADQGLADRLGNRLGARVGVELAHRVADVGLDRSAEMPSALPTRSFVIPSASRASTSRSRFVSGRRRAGRSRERDRAGQLRVDVRSAARDDVERP